ncbi:hypothetical protein [Pseudoalteromonas spongiae]|uniref:hypothetical protein n=1 Tax=Pseudoalteromonas spongiae TaxID=298657 RepID=UPI003734D73B
MKLEFLICGTPNDAFCSQIAFFRICLDFLGGDYQQARVVAVFGDHTEETIPSRWKPFFERVDVVWAHEVGATNIDYSAQHYARFEHLDPDADLCVICDADTIFLNPLEDLTKYTSEADSLFGVIAHYHFPADLTEIDKTDEWQYLFENVVQKTPDCKYQYSLTNHPNGNQCPFYINYGFLAGTPSTLKALYMAESKIIDKVQSYVGSYWSAQIAMPLAAELGNITTTALPMRYNYPNDPVADEIYPEEMKKIICLHYLRHSEFDRQEIFSTEQNFNKFLDLGLAGSNKVFQDHVKRVTNETYPFRSGD